MSSDEAVQRLAENLHDRLEQSLGALAKGAGNSESALLARSPATATAPPASMKLPPALVEEAAKIVFEFWERHAAERGEIPSQWERLIPRYQLMWIGIERVVLEMAIMVILTDIHRYFEQSNGDMGAAFASALRRYAAEVLEIRLK